MAQIGDLITFTYPVGPGSGTRATDPNPIVLVFHPDWQNEMHCLAFSRLSGDEQNIIRMLVSPKYQVQHEAALARKNPKLVVEFNEIVEHVGATLITSPEEFYHKAIRPFIKPRNWQPYRRYIPSKMTQIRIIEPMEVMTGETTPSLMQRWKRFASGMRGPRFRNPAV
jgi:hypothetical protein